MDDITTRKNIDKINIKDNNNGKIIESKINEKNFIYDEKDAKEKEKEISISNNEDIIEKQKENIEIKEIINVDNPIKETKILLDNIKDSITENNEKINVINNLEETKESEDKKNFIEEIKKIKGEKNNENKIEEIKEQKNADNSINISQESKKYYK